MAKAKKPELSKVVKLDVIDTNTINYLQHQLNEQLNMFVSYIAITKGSIDPNEIINDKVVTTFKLGDDNKTVEIYLEEIEQPEQVNVDQAISK